MQIQVIPCGFLKVRAVEMIKPWSLEKIRRKYPVDREGFMKLSMNALLVKEDEYVVLIDPGTADFLPARLKREYGFEMLESLEDVLREAEVRVEELTDVVFTHLHFDHGSAAFKRIPGNIVKRFPNARYHVLKEHYNYALNPDRVEASSFSTIFFQRLEKIHWIEDWKSDWMKFSAFHGHTKAMVVPEIRTEEGKIYFPGDLIPMEVFLEPEVYCGYDLDPVLQLREKKEFLEQLDPGSRLILFHDSLKESTFYS
jgi:glyoxylase-like metal-dependent hydrolase (beta-lactamase superfamily II)